MARNFLDYPVDYVEATRLEEATRLLERFKSECDPELIGDPTPVIIDWILDQLWRIDYLVNS